MEPMYRGIPFSPQTTLTDSIGAADTVIPVADVSAFPDPPNYATIGTDSGGETIKYTAKAGNSLSGCTRGVEGTAKAWPSGSVIGRNFTAKDLAALQKNVSNHEKALGGKYSATNPPPYPVTAVNGKTGDVTLEKSDVGLGNVADERQYSANNPPPYPVTTVNGKTGAVTVPEPAEYTGTFLSTGWVADTIYAYKQTISISGLLASYSVRPDVDVALTMTAKDTDAEALAGFALIQAFDTGADSLTAYCMDEAPSVNVPVVVRVFK